MLDHEKLVCALRLAGAAAEVAGETLREETFESDSGKRWQEALSRALARVTAGSRNFILWCERKKEAKDGRDG